MIFLGFFFFGSSKEAGCFAGALDREREETCLNWH